MHQQVQTPKTNILAQQGAVQAAGSSSKALQVVAGFDDRTCRGSVLVWNNGSTAVEASVVVSNLPFASVQLEEWRLDDFHPLGVSFLTLLAESRCRWMPGLDGTQRSGQRATHV